MSIRVLLVDDQALVRSGFRLILETREDLEVVGEAEDGREAVDLARRLNPDVILMDVRMPNVDGVEATRRLAAAGSPARVLILTTFDLDEYVYEAIRAGASGFLLKDVQPAQLVDAVRVVAAGEALLAPTVTRRLLDRFADQLPGTKPPPELARLTERELEILTLLAEGLSNAELAERLFLSETTVKTHVSSVLAQARPARPRPGRRPRVQGRPRATSSLRTSRTVLAAEGPGRTVAACTPPTRSRPPVSRSASAAGSPSTTSSCASRAARRSDISGPTAPARRR